MTIVEEMQVSGEELPRAGEDDDGGKDYGPADYHDPRSVLFPVEVRGSSVRVNITIDDGLLARVDELSRRLGGSRSALLARGARMLLAAEDSLWTASCRRLRRSRGLRLGGLPDGDHQQAQSRQDQLGLAIAGFEGPA